MDISGLHNYVNRHGVIGLILEYDGQLEAIAKVEEARRRGAHHQRKPGGEIGLPGAKLFASAIYGNNHHAVAGEVIGEVDLHLRCAAFVCVDGRGKGRQRVEIGAHSNRRCGGIPTAHIGHEAFGCGGWCSFHRHFFLRHTANFLGCGSSLHQCFARAGGISQRQRVHQNDAGAPVHAIEISVAILIEHRNRVGHLIAG